MSGEWNDEIAAVASSLRKSTGAWWRGECPVCPRLNGKSGGDSLAVNAESGGYHCLRCGTRGRLREIPDWIGSGPAVTYSVVEAPEEMELPEDFVTIGDDPFTMPALRYLEKRCVPRETIQALGIGVAFRGWLRGRVIVPVRGLDGALAGWVARIYCAAGYGPKYRYPRGMPRGTTLFRGGLTRVVTEEPLLVVEGVFDALPYPTATAVLGKPSHAHVEMLAASRRPVAVALDADARRDAEALVGRINLRGGRASLVRLPATLDPGSLAERHGPGYLLDAARAAFGS